MNLLHSRSGKAFLNTLLGFGLEVVAVICGLILPRAILKAFGSSYNGITTSITQFISCIALLKGGISGVTRVALYKPLSDKNTFQISEILFQTEKFMKRISRIFVIFIIAFACIYPLLVSDEFGWFFSASLVCIISISTFAQYYFGATYQMLLMADQCFWICHLVDICTYVLNTAVSIILITIGLPIHAVKFGSALVFVLGPLFYNIYVKKKYCLKKVQNTNTDYLKQRWDAFGHAIAEFINYNTDVIVITIFLNLKEVSVYSIYHLVLQGIKKATNVLITGFGAAFGDMYAKKQFDLLKSNLGIYEVIVFSITTVFYSVTLVMILPFVLLYTKGITDVEYIRPAFAFVLCFAGVFGCFRIPYQTVVLSIGHYKQTRNGSFVEAAINIGSSIILVFKFGIIGVAFGTLVAAIFRTLQYAIYLHKNIIKRSYSCFISHTVGSVSIILIVYFLSKLYIPNQFSIPMWLILSFVTGVIAVVLVIIVNLIFHFNDTKNLYKKLKKMIRHK